jgi:NAD(P)-dependent dehydrogenase (short-subunit alcohol dehydrogenase family)
VLGYLRCAREVAPHMAERGWGRIINISGLGARNTGNMVTTMRNVSVAALSKNLGDELGPKGINVSCIHPGLVRTEKTPGVVAARAAAQGITPEEAEKRMVTNAVRKLIDSEDIAYLAVMLASPRSVAINGDAIAAGGGQPGSVHY